MIVVDDQITTNGSHEGALSENPVISVIGRLDVQQHKRGSPLFCMGNTMSPTSTEADHRRSVLNAELPLLSECPGFHHQDISSIGYLNPISPT